MSIRRQGFTLLEISIVLVIVGVLVAGIMLSRSLILSSKMQTLITDIDNYTTATANFKKQYQSLPGDFANANAIWAAATNGNSDGEIGAVGGQEFETFGYWQQLYLAGMFPTSLSGTAGSAGVYAANIGKNIPSGNIEGTGVSAIWWGTVAAGDNYRFAGYYGNVLQFGTIPANCTTSPTLNTCTYGPALTADQAQGLDSKIDDGTASSGAVRAFNSTSYNCTNSSGVYNISNTGINCALTFVEGF